MLLDKRRCMAKKNLTFFLCILTASATSGEGTTRSELVHNLLNDTRYDHSLPPEYSTGNVTDVSVQLAITDLDSESDINMEYDCTLFLLLNWTDTRLNFTAYNTSYERLQLGNNFLDKVWIPDLFFYHQRKSKMQGLFTKNQMVHLFKNGSIIYSGRFNIKWHCKIDLRKYPFDNQTCEVVIESYAFTKDYIMLHWNGDPAVKIDNIANLKVIGHSQKHKYNSPYGDSLGTFSTLVANISFIRPTESFQVMYVAPPVILVIVSLISFLLGGNVQARIIVPTGALTQLIIQWTGIYNKLPPVSVLILLDVWMLTNLAFIGIVLILNAGICHFVIPKDKVEEMEMAEMAVQGGTKNVDDTEETNLNTSEDKEEEVEEVETVEMAVQGGTKDVDDTEETNLDTSEVIPASGRFVSYNKVKTNERKKQIKGRKRNTSNEDETKLQKIEASKNKKPKSSIAEEKKPLVENLWTNRTSEDASEKDPTEDSSSVNTQDRPSVSTADKPSVSAEHRSSNELTTAVSIRMRNSTEDDVSGVQTESNETELKEDFLQLLKDNKGITTSTQWETAEGIFLKDDPRYKRACKRDKVPQWYKEYITEKIKEDFLSLLHEKVRTIKTWKRAEMMIDHDHRYKVVVSDEIRKQWFAEYRDGLLLFDLSYPYKTLLKTVLKKAQQKICSNINANSISFTLLLLGYVIFTKCFCAKWSSNKD